MFIFPVVFGLNGLIVRRWLIGACLFLLLQIGFLTEWQLYAQKLEGDMWKGEKLDKAKLDKMSGMFCLSLRCWRMGFISVADGRIHKLQTNNSGNCMS